MSVRITLLYCWFKDIICNISAFKCQRTTRSLSYMLLSSVIILSRCSIPTTFNFFTGYCDFRETFRQQRWHEIVLYPPWKSERIGGIERERAHGKILPLPVEKIGKIESLDLMCGCSNPFREQQGVLLSATYPAYVYPLNTSKQIFYSLLHCIYPTAAVTYSD